MERIGVRELNQNTSQVLARVRGGETVEITDHGHPIARLVPVGDDRSTLAKLVTAGRAVAPTDAALFRFRRGSVTRVRMCAARRSRSTTPQMLIHQAGTA